MQKRYVLTTLLSPLSMIGEVCMEVSIPFIMAKIIDIGIAGRDIPYVTKTGLFMVGLAVISLLFGCAGSFLAAYSSQGFAKNLRQRIYCKIQGFSFSNLDKFSTASLVTRLTTDITMCTNVYQMLIRICIRSPFMMIAGCLMAFKINTELALIFLIAVPFLAVAILLLSTFAHPRFLKMMKTYDGLNASVQENLVGIRIVKAYVRDEFEFKKFEKAAEELCNAQYRAEKIIIWMIPLMQLVMYLTMSAVVWFGGHKVVFGSMTAGQLISFFAYVTQILMSLMMLGMIFVSLVMVRASAGRIKEVLAEESDIKSPESAAVTSVKDGSIEFRDVSFGYNNRYDNLVLENITLKIESGQVVGIIGGTGSSKTTLISLIPRLYDALSGMIFVGGEDVRNYDLKALRDGVALVLQKNVLFSGSIKENLRWGNEKASDQEVELACQAADADSFIKSFPDGYDTVLGQGGVNVSGGQKQRLCIARALLKKPKILILDDSTSAVDTATEGRIRASLKSIAPGTTKIIIAQRISSVKDADIIFVLDEGKLNGMGSHEELLRNNKIYREVYESQQQGSGDADMLPEKM
ncbi:ABC transporter ATP-binding protein [Treponema sp. JC4]|uniref:ABC transporter ATP-binding protein n=1 Tax=Treponema sp. JC4 TaxID=1124982 RepID=UPI000586E5A5|nr:ABC transporter ATP-binding protein [Treponema sp. JC4]